MSINIDEAFADLDKFYPGSKRSRREPVAQPARSAVSWDSRPVTKLYEGQPREFFMPKALADALGRSTVTIRLWERNGYIPKAPFRLPGHVRAGKQIPGKRVYTRELIEIAVEEFAKRGLIDSPRVEWKQHRDLTIALYERWNAALENPAN